MADRVLFLTNNSSGDGAVDAPWYHVDGEPDDVLYTGYSSGFTGLPFPWLKGAGNGTSAIGPFTLSRTGELYFRVKEWTATGSITCTCQSGASGGSTNATYTIDCSGVLDLTAGSGPTRELDLLTPQTLSGTASVSFSAVDEYGRSFGGPATVVFTIFNSVLVTYPGSGTYYPTARWWRDFPANPNDYYAGASFQVGNIDYFGAIDSTSPAAAGVEISGVNLYIGANGDYSPPPVPPYPGNLVVTGSTVAIVPSAWWPYANSKGLPVWNTATGEPLQDPLS